MEDQERARARKRRWEVKNRARLNAAQRERYATDAAYREERLAMQARVPRAKRRAWNARHREAHREAERARVSQWARDNPEKVANIKAKRRARRTGAIVEPVDRQAVLIRDAGRCGICGLTVGPDWHLDHIKPLARGGEHSYANVQVAHPRCNTSKGARLRAPSADPVRYAA